MSEDRLPEPLRKNVNDHMASLLRATIGNTPLVGAFVTELVGVIIPNLREERLARYLARLSARLAETGRHLDDLEGRIGPEKIALFEDGARGAVQATTEARIEALVNIVQEGLNGSDREAEDQRAFVRLLNDLTEGDVRYLLLWTDRYSRDSDWRSANGYAWKWEWRETEPGGRKKSVSIGDPPMDTLVEFSRQGRLLGAGFLERKFARQREPEDLGVFEEDIVLTERGLSFLRRLGLLGADEQ